MTDVTEHDFDIVTPVCQTCAAAQRYDRILSERDDKARGDSPPADRHDRADGRTIRMVYKGKVQPVSNVPEKDESPLDE